MAESHTCWTVNLRQNFLKLWILCFTKAVWTLLVLVSLPLKLALCGMCDLHFTLPFCSIKPYANTIVMVSFSLPIISRIMLIIYHPGHEGKANYFRDFLPHHPLCVSSQPSPHSLPFLPTAVIPSGRPSRLWGSVDDYRNNLFSNGC